jgi:hypothetical protein
VDVDVDVEALLDEAAPEDDELAEPDAELVAAALLEAVDAVVAAVVLCGAILLDTLVIAIDRFP